MQIQSYRKRSCPRMQQIPTFCRKHGICKFLKCSDLVALWFQQTCYFCFKWVFDMCLLMCDQNEISEVVFDKCGKSFMKIGLIIAIGLACGSERRVNNGFSCYLFYCTRLIVNLWGPSPCKPNKLWRYTSNVRKRCSGRL